MMKGIRLVEICKNLRDITSPNFPTSLINHTGCSLKATDVLMLSGFWRKPPLLPPSASLLLEAELIAHAVSRFQSTLHPSFPSLPYLALPIRDGLFCGRGQDVNSFTACGNPTISLAARRRSKKILALSSSIQPLHLRSSFFLFFLHLPSLGCTARTR